jgi:predicted nucleic acid-binding protein
MRRNNFRDYEMISDELLKITPRKKRWILTVLVLLSLVCVISQTVASPKAMAKTDQAITSLKMMVKTESEFAQILKDNNLKVVPSTLHFNYYYTTLDGWKKIFDETGLIKQYKLDVNDCVHHSLTYIIVCNQHDLNAIGMVLGKYKTENHAFNIFYTDIGFYIWEGTIQLEKNLMSLDEAKQQGYTIGNIIY